MGGNWQMNKNIENNPMNHAKAKVYEVGATAASKAGGALTALEDEFATAGSSMQENKLETMATDLRSFIRKYPFALLFVGIGLGCVLFRNRND
jgi:hypothetical protein